jgi:cyclic-di-GMP-binding protein
MPSFDVVSEVDMMEVKNALEQANKELANRFDFRDAKAEIVLEKESINLSAINQFKINALEEIVLGKLARRNISLKNIDRADPDISPLGHARQELKLKQGLETDVAKTICTAIRDAKFKVQTQIQDRQIRVTSKDRDVLQEVIAFLRGKDFPVALAYNNFRP